MSNRREDIMKRLTLFAVLALAVSAILLSVLATQPAFAEEGSPTPSVDIEKFTNGEDADTAPGPEVLWGTPVTWTYVVTNTGDVPLTDIWVWDSHFGAIGLSESPLNPGATLTFSKTETSTRVGQYANNGYVAAWFGDVQVSDNDDSHYFGKPLNITIDIKPGSFPNSINLRSGGNIAVGVLTGEYGGVFVDATKIVVESLVFAGAPAIYMGESPQDLDGDGDLDMVFHFDVQQLNLDIGSEEASLTGCTEDGIHFTGTDSIRVVKSKK
jgi:hypothetical protein